jgi:hypothetical protein
VNGEPNDAMVGDAMMDVKRVATISLLATVLMIAFMLLGMAEAKMKRNKDCLDRGCWIDVRDGGDDECNCRLRVRP